MYIGQYNNFSKSKFLISILAIMGLSLNQSIVKFGVNFSFADICLIILLFDLIFNNQIVIPKIPMIFFFMLSFSTIFTAGFIVPIFFTYSPTLIEIFKGYIKLLIMFIYFIVGFNMQRLNLTKQMLKWFAIGAFCIATVSIFLGKVSIFSNVLFYQSSSRLKGLMNDPNYFSVLQIIALSFYKSKVENMPKFKKYTINSILIISILMSGSKTGTIILLNYYLFRILGLFIGKKYKIKSYLNFILIISFIIVIIILFADKLEYLNLFLIKKIPAFRRVSLIFTDFNYAFSGDGSSRDRAWSIAMEIVKKSPIIGIGVGIYSSFSRELFGNGIIAHNTYLQLLVEWGSLFAVPFFLAIIYLVIYITVKKRYEDKRETYIYRNIIIIFLISSMAISLNNARLFWLIFGGFLIELKTIYKSRCTLYIDA